MKGLRGMRPLVLLKGDVGEMVGKVFGGGEVAIFEIDDPLDQYRGVIGHDPQAHFTRRHGEVDDGVVGGAAAVDDRVGVGVDHARILARPLGGEFDFSDGIVSEDGLRIAWVTVVPSPQGHFALPVNDHAALLGLLVGRSHGCEEDHRHEIGVPRRNAQGLDPSDRETGK